MTDIAPFNAISLVGTLNGGVETIARVLVNSQGVAQVTAAQRIEAIFSARINAARAAKNDEFIRSAILGLENKMAQLIGRKDRITEGVAVITKALEQTAFIRSFVTNLQQQLTALEAGSITASTMSELLDNSIRKINILAREATVTFTDGRFSSPINLINSRSRLTYSTQNLFAPFNSSTDSFLIGGVYLGTDYTITEDGGNLLLSDTGFLLTEAATGTLFQYTSYPDSPTGSSAAVADITVNFFTTSSGDIQITAAGLGGTIDGTLTKGGLGILDSFLYNDLASQSDIDNLRTDLRDAESLLLLSEADFRSARSLLVSRASVFDAQIFGVETEITKRIREIKDDRDADVLAAQLEFAIARFNFALLASRGNVLIQTMLLSGDSLGDRDTTRFGQAITGRLFTLSA